MKAFFNAKEKKMILENNKSKRLSKNQQTN